MIKHIVLLRFKATLSSTQVQEHENNFLSLQKSIPCIASIEWGHNVSEEGLTKGFTHCFQFGFMDVDARDQYLVHPTHLEFSDSVKPSLEDVLVIDYFKG